MEPKRYLLLVGVALLAFFTLSPALAAQSPQIPLAGSAIPQFVDPLPILSVAGGTMQTVDAREANAGAGDTFATEIHMREFQAKVLPTGFVPPAGWRNATSGTWVWGYINGTAAPTSLVDTYIGPVIVAKRGLPFEAKWVNDLGNSSTTNVFAYKYSTDQTLHWADPLGGGMNMFAHMAMPPAFGSPGAQNYAGPIPAVVHLHGGEVPPVLDGGPDAWFTSDGLHKGKGFYSKDGATAFNYSIYRYPNTQEAANIWFHDHTLGATRLNVYAGLAGAYVLTDPNQVLPTGLSAIGLNNGGTEEPIVPLVIQDRMFDTNGEFFLPADSAGGVLWALNPEHPYWNPEFVGDAIVVNGKTWPFFSVAPKRYRFMILNGSNARTYELFLNNQATGANGPPLWVIGTDGGYLDTPVKIDPALGQKLVLQPGERYDVIVDFAGFANSNLILRNTGRTPYPKGPPPQGSTLGRIIQFRVGAGPADNASYDPSSLTPLRTGTNATKNNQKIQRLVNTTAGTLAAGVTAQKTRQLSLNEVMGMPQAAIDPVTGVLTNYPGGPLEILVNNTKWSGERITGVMNGMYTMEPIPGFKEVSFNGQPDYYSELPMEGETEVWEVVNLTADAHPIHLHLVQFQLINRQNYNVNTYSKAYAAAFPGGGYDPMTLATYPAGVFIPGFGPPLAYDPAANLLSGGKYGGNPDVTRYLQGQAKPPLPQEAGWKDTVVMYPGQVTRIAVRWAPTDLPANTTVADAYYPFDPQAMGFGYVWHCHIIDHEDNEMMRPTQVQPNPSAPTTRSYVNY